MDKALMLPIPMTEREFGNIFAKLALQLRWTDADAAAIKSYFEALRDLRLEALQASATAFAKEPGRRFFPTSAEWREVASRAEMDLLRKALPHTRDEPWHVECRQCEDSGWSLHDCTGDSACGRRKKHYAHGYARVCPCRPTNRTFQRHQKFGAGD